MDTVVIGFADTWLLLVGKSSFSAFGWIIVDVIIKKISNRNTMSVMDDMLNCGLTLFLDVIAINFLFARFVKQIHKF